MAFTSLEEIVASCEAKKKEFWEIIVEDDLAERGVDRFSSFERMQKTWQAMLSAVDSYEQDRISASGLSGHDGYKMELYRKTKDSLCGDFVNQVMSIALQTSESNACMKRIVAAPTAGSCGVLPAVLIPYYRAGKAEEQQILQAMYTAAGIGQVIAARASISGAVGGCQAEIGSASAMAAGAMTYLQGGNAHQITHAAAMALKGLLGLVCDPVAGLVEVPCVKRNVIGAVNAISCADMVMAGMNSKIPPDQVIDAMKAIGDKMDSTLRETGEGGLAATPAAIKIKEKMFN